MIHYNNCMITVLRWCDVLTSNFMKLKKQSIGVHVESTCMQEFMFRTNVLFELRRNGKPLL